jgi:hypothetical protein
MEDTYRTHDGSLPVELLQFSQHFLFTMSPNVVNNEAGMTKIQHSAS